MLAVGVLVEAPIQPLLSAGGALGTSAGIPAADAGEDGGGRKEKTKDGEGKGSVTLMGFKLGSEIRKRAIIGLVKRARLVADFLDS